MAALWPCLGWEMFSAAEDGFHTLDVEDLPLHYPQGPALLAENFYKQFVHTWELCLASCAATFHKGIIDVHQVLLSNGINNDLPSLCGGPVRWY